MRALHAGAKTMAVLGKMIFQILTIIDAALCCTDLLLNTVKALREADSTGVTIPAVTDHIVSHMRTYVVCSGNFIIFLME
jgi:hypothetical protein